MNKIRNYLTSFSTSHSKEIIVLLCFSGFYYLFLSQQSFQMDYNAFYYASDTIRNGLNPYYNHILISESFFDAFNLSNLSRFIYPPSALLFFYPLSTTSYYVSRLLFSGLVWISLFGVMLILSKQFVLEKYQIILILVSFPILSNFALGQIDLIILFLVLSFIYVKNKHISSVFLAIAISIKLTPVFLLIYLFFKKEFYTIGLVIFYTLLITLISIYFFGIELYVDFINKFIFSTLDRYIIDYSFIDYQRIGNLIITNDGTYRFAHIFIGGNLNVFAVYINSIFIASTGNLIVYIISLVILILYSFKHRNNSRIEFYYIYLFLTLLPNHHLWIMGMVWFIPLAFFLLNRYGNNLMSTILILSPLLLPRNLLSVITDSLPSVFYSDLNLILGLLVAGSYYFYFKLNHTISLEV